MTGPAPIPPTDLEIGARHIEFMHDWCDRLISLATVMLAEASGPGTSIVDGRRLVHVAVQTGLSTGVELGLRTALLDPESAARIREAMTAMFHSEASEFGPAGLNASLANAQGYIDALLAPSNRP